MVPAIAPRFFIGRPPAPAAAPYPGAFGWGPYGPSAIGWRPAAAPWGSLPRPTAYGAYPVTYVPVYSGYGWPAWPSAMPYAAWRARPYSPWPPAPYGAPPWALPGFFHPYAPAFAAGLFPYGGWLPAPPTVPVVSPVMPVWYNQSYRPVPEAWTQGAPWAAPAVMTLAAPPTTAPLAAEPGVEVTAEVAPQIFRETAR